MKTTIAYILILLSVLLSILNFGHVIPVLINRGRPLLMERGLYLIPLLMQLCLFIGLELLPKGNSLKNIGKIIFTLFSILFLLVMLLFMSRFGVMYFIQFLIAVLFAICSASQKQNPITEKQRIMLYEKLLVFFIIIFVWVNDISFRKSFVFHGHELTYEHALFNHSFKSLYKTYYIDNNELKKYAIDEYMNLQCEKYMLEKNQNEDAEQLKKLIEEVVKNDFNYFELYKSATRLDSVDINKVVENKNSIFNIFPYGECGN